VIDFFNALMLDAVSIKVSLRKRMRKAYPTEVSTGMYLHVFLQQLIIGLIYCNVVISVAKYGDGKPHCVRSTCPKHRIFTDGSHWTHSTTESATK
jgi:hypothetical protein